MAHRVKVLNVIVHLTQTDLQVTCYTNYRNELQEMGPQIDLQIIPKLTIRIDVPYTSITEFSGVSCGH